MSEFLPLMPWPRRVTRTEAPLELTERGWRVDWSGARTLRLERVVERYVERMLNVAGSGARLTIDCAAPSAPYPDLDDDESYLLKIDSSEARLTAANEWGIVRGLATLAQLTGPSP